MGNFFKRSRAANSAALGQIRLKFELIPDIMVVLLTCKNEEDQIKNECTGVLTRLYIDFSHTQGQQTPQSTKFELIQAFMVVLVTCKK